MGRLEQAGRPRSAPARSYHRAPPRPRGLTLGRQGFRRAVDWLAAEDRDLGRVVERFGPPPFWSRPPGFPTLVRIILEQQVSLASARAAFRRLTAAADPLEPAAFLRLSPAELRAIGFSRQKAAYCRELSRAIAGGELDLAALARLDDAAAHRRLTGLRGVGSWTADVYLLMALRRPDVWPVTDLALRQALVEVKLDGASPEPDAFEAMAEGWRPFRAVAARVLWHHYLSRRARTG